MNPWAFVAIAVGILLIVIGIKGTQHGVVNALVNRQGQSSSSSSSGGTSTGPILA